jgi:hypothetical protein
MRMGLALTVWQNVEEQHYHLFLKLLGSQEGDISSVVYFSVESFEARRRMVGRMVHYYSTSKELRIVWNKIEKQLKDHNESRNKIAHYGSCRQANRRLRQAAARPLDHPPRDSPAPEPLPRPETRMAACLRL